MPLNLCHVSLKIISDGFMERQERLKKASRKSGTPLHASLSVDLELEYESVSYAVRIVSIYIFTFF